MTRAIGIALVALSSLSTSIAFAAPTDADKKKDAQAHFDAALKAATDNDQKGALAEFRAAYDTYPSFRVLYNIGQLCVRVGDNACAVTAYQKYVRDGGADVPTARRTTLEAEIPKLQKTLGTVTVKSNVTGADVSVDETPMGKTPLEPFVVNAGAHKIVLNAQGRTAEQSVKIGAGESQTVELDTADAKTEVVPHQGPSKKTDPPVPDKEAGTKPPKKSGEVPIVPWVVTGGLGVGTIVTGIFAAKAYGNFKDKRDSFPVTRNELDASQKSARTLFIVTTVLGAATLISAGVSGYLTVASKQTGANSSVRVYAGLGELGIGGAF